MIRNLFPYRGCKRTSLTRLLPHLPYNHTYVEPFCGTGIVLVNRAPCPREVLNDLDSGITNFLQTIQNPAYLLRMFDWFENTVHSKEEFQYCKNTWASMSDPVERACRWFYIACYSFSGDHDYWGRSVSAHLPDKADLIQRIATRIKDVGITNMDWLSCVKMYDGPDTVFYLDPPYYQTKTDVYVDAFLDHTELLNHISQMQGFVAISGYPNTVYDSLKWDARYTWIAESGVGTRSIYQGKGEEVLWIKNAR